MTTDFPPPRACGGQVLYLDYDGALHPEGVYQRPGGRPYIREPAGHQLFEHAGLLVELLLPYPDVRIVLSTTWVRIFGFRRAAEYLPDALRRRVIGATYHREMRREMGSSWFAEMPRGWQVRSDVARRTPTEWLAVDDDTDGWGEIATTHLVATDPVDGIACPAVLTKLTDALERFR